MRTLSYLIAPLLLTLATVAPAQTVYRCGNSYSQQPCPGGNAIDTSDPRTPEQRKAAEDGARHERRTADSLEKDRLKEEAAAIRAAERADKAQRAAEKAARKKAPAPAKNQHAKDRLPAYNAPAATPGRKK